MSAHTAGPWHADSLDRVRSENGIVIARCERVLQHEYMDSKEQSANARLCAAAPKLAALLRQVYQDNLSFAGRQLVRETLNELGEL